MTLPAPIAITTPSIVNPSADVWGQNINTDLTTLANALNALIAALGGGTPSNPTPKADITVVDNGDGTYDLTATNGTVFTDNGDGTYDLTLPTTNVAASFTDNGDGTYGVTS